MLFITKISISTSYTSKLLAKVIPIIKHKLKILNKLNNQKNSLNFFHLLLTKV